jgi:iron complex outermembrane recepter protein
MGNYKISFPIIVGVLGAAASVAYAAPPDSDVAVTTVPGTASQLEEIVVTATKRKEELSKVPISISAYTHEALETSGVKSVADLAALTPGVEFDNSAGFGPGTLTNIAIRGINSSIGTSTTGIYVDDTPIQSRVTSLSYFGNPYPLMFDVDRVEVERGPQGTLFGAGAEGGALRFISPEPGLSAYTGFARSEFAATKDGDPSYEFGGAIGGPIVEDKLGFRVSAWFRNDGGYVDRVNPFDGSTVDANSNWTQSYAVRAAVTLAPNDALKITPSIYDQSIHNNDSSAYFEYLSNPGSGEFKNGRLLEQPNTDQFSLPSLKIEADLGGASLTSVTSYVNRSGKLLDDNTSFTGATLGAATLPYGNPLGPEFPASYADAAPTMLTTSLHQISEEARLASADRAARLQWTAGLYYSNTTQNDGEDVYSPFYAINVFESPAAAPLLATSLQSRDSQIAAFGQIDYRILDPLTLTVGLRVARTDAKFTELQAGPLSAPQFPGAAGEQKETPVTPKIGLSYSVDDGNMIYASISKGYRVGGGNPPIPLLSANNPAGCPLPNEPGSYSSDSVWSYELGAKDKLFDGRLRLDTSVFHVDWTNIQQSIFLASCGFGYVANTGKATSNGFDFALQAAATEALTLGLAVAYTDAHITQNVSILGSPVVQSGDVIGSPPAVGSPWNITGSFKYAFRVFSGRDAYIRAEDIFHSKNSGPFSSDIPASTGYAPLIPANPSTNQLNLRTGIVWSRIDLSLFVNNVLNGHPAIGRYQDTAAARLFTDTTFRPLTGGITAEFRF